MARTTTSSQLAKLQKQMAELQKKQQALLAKTNTKVLSQVVALIKKNGLSLDDIAQALKSDKATKSTAQKTARKKSASSGVKVAPKYRNPENAEQTWTGRGKAPLWVQALQAAGTLESALIPKAIDPV